MRYLYLALLMGLPQLAAAQTVAVADSAAADSTRSPAAASEYAAYWVRSRVDSTGECTEVLQWEAQRGLVRVFHPSGHLKQYLPYANLAAGQLHGVVTSWYDNGQLEARQTFLHGQREGELLVYYPTGQPKRQTQYEAGRELLGDCFAETGARLPYFPYEQPPLYPGGQLQLIKEIKKALRNWRPTGPVQLSQAQLHVNFLVDKQGQVVDPQATLSDENYSLAMLPGAQPSPASWQTVGEQIVAPLLRRAQGALMQLTKSFYPGQRDGATTSWHYSLTIPLEYEVWAPPARNIRR